MYSPNGSGVYGWNTAFIINTDGSISPSNLTIGAVSSVAGRSGSVLLSSSDLTDSTAVGRALFSAANLAAQKSVLNYTPADIGAATRGPNTDITGLSGLTGPLASASTFLFGAAQSTAFGNGSTGAPGSLTASIPNQITLPYPAGTLNTKQTALRVQMGNCTESNEFDSQPGLTQSYSTAAVVGCTTTPSGTSISLASWPDFGVAGVANTLNANKSAVGLHGLAGMGVDGALAQGGNYVASNTPPGILAADGNGHNVQALNGLEADMNIFKTAGGVGPTGVFQGVTSYLAGTVQPLSATVDAFAAISSGNPVSGLPVPQWVNAFASRNGMAQNALWVGTATNAVPANSQTLSFHMGTAGAVPLINTMYGQNDGSFIFNTMGDSSTGQMAIGPDGSLFLFSAGASQFAQMRPASVGGTILFTNLTVTGSIISGLSPSSAWTIDGAANGILVAPGGTLAVPSGSGMLLVRESTTGNECLFFAGVGSTKLVQQLVSNCSATVGANLVSLTFNGSAYIVTNGLGIASTINVMNLRNASST